MLKGILCVYFAVISIVILSFYRNIAKYDETFLEIVPSSVAAFASCKYLCSTIGI